VYFEMCKINMKHAHYIPCQNRFHLTVNPITMTLLLEFIHIPRLKLTFDTGNVKTYQISQT
jgi:hypothetical protein